MWRGRGSHPVSEEPGQQVAANHGQSQEQELRYSVRVDEWGAPRGLPCGGSLSHDSGIPTALGPGTAALERLLVLDGEGATTLESKL